VKLALHSYFIRLINFGNSTGNWHSSSRPANCAFSASRSSCSHETHWQFTFVLYHILIREFLISHLLSLSLNPGPTERIGRGTTSGDSQRLSCYALLVSSKHGPRATVRILRRSTSSMTIHLLFLVGGSGWGRERWWCGTNSHKFTNDGVPYYYPPRYPHTLLLGSS
jgi:hypothetical protein